MPNKENPGEPYDGTGKNYGTGWENNTNRIRLTEDDQNPDLLVVHENIYRTKDGRLVHENTPDGAWPAYRRHTRIPVAEAIAAGLWPAENKSAKPGGKK